MAILEIGVSAAVAAGIANWLRLRRDPDWPPRGLAAPAPPPRPAMSPGGRAAPEDDGHRIYLDPWAGEEGRTGRAEDRPPAGPRHAPLILGGRRSAPLRGAERGDLPVHRMGELHLAGLLRRGCARSLRHSP